MSDLEHIRALRAANQHEAARQALLSLLQTNPSDPELQYETACIHDFLGLEHEAVPFYLAAIKTGLSGESLRGAYLGLGSTYRTIGAYQESRAIFEQGLADFPEAGELRVFLAMTHYNLQQHQQAMQLLLEVIADTSSDPAISQYQRAIRFYAMDLDQRW